MSGAKYAEMVSFTHGEQLGRLIFSDRVLVATGEMAATQTPGVLSQAGQVSIVEQAQVVMPLGSLVALRDALNQAFPPEALPGKN